MVRLFMTVGSNTAEEGQMAEPISGRAVTMG